MDYPGKVITKTQVTPTQISASGNWTLDDQAAAIKNNNWPVALVPNPISKSLRFNSADSAYLNRTLTTPTDGKRWTWSGWVKRGILTNGTGTAQQLFSAGSATAFFRFSTTDTLLSGWTGAANLETTQVFRDASAWYHIMLVVDTTQATASNRVKYYVNGSQITAFSSTDYPTQNSTTTINSAVAHNIGAYTSSQQYLNGYMTEINFIDGQALTPSSFGMTNPQTGQWIPLKYSGTYGTNGFYLNFKDATSTTTLGYDYSGNANNWTTNNFSVTAGAGNDSLTDVPTPWFAYNTTGDVGGVVRGNYATWNPLILAKNFDSNSQTITNGNLVSQFTSNTTAGKFGGASTIGVSSGKWYCEIDVVGGGSYPTYTNVGITGDPMYNATITNASIGQQDYSVGWYNASGVVYRNGSIVYTDSQKTSPYKAMIALDVDAGKVYFGFDGTWINSANPASGTGGFNILSVASTPTGQYFISCFFTSTGMQGSYTINAGQRPFAYTPPTGFRSLCTTNLPATAIGFGLTNQGDDYMNVVTYTGTGSARSVTGVGFQPDFVWNKSRSNAYSNWLEDAVRGASKVMSSNSTDAEVTDTAFITAFDSDGFTVGNSAGVNANGATYVAWNWKAGGTGVTNTDGTITSTVSANTTAGFSVVTYAGNGASGATVGHGLGVAPKMMIVKCRTSGTNSWTSWQVYHASLTNPATSFLRLNETSATYTGFASAWNSTAPTSSVFSIRYDSGAGVNGSGDTFVAYCFAPVAGYSAFGSYVGNGSSDGPFAYLGFRPKFVLLKRSSAAGNNWLIYDSARDTYNVVAKDLYPNTSGAEATGTNMDFLSNGFKIRAAGDTHNGSGSTYIYAAFAESPFQFANAR